MPAEVGDHVLVVAPTRRDGEVTLALLAQAGVRASACELGAAATRVDDDLGAILLTDKALGDGAMPSLLAALARQPGWSDVPVLLLTPHRELPPNAADALRLLTNVTLLDRPVSTRSMVSAVLAALRARRRQYQVRDQLAQQQAAEQALRDADRRKNEFLATLAHELRNPLAPIRTGLHVMGEVPADSNRALQLRRMMDRQLRLLVKLIDDLLDVSRIATGKVLLQRERVDLRGVVAAALESCQPVIEAARHRVAWQPPDTPVWVVGDAARLAQVVGNLVNNAAKYTPDGGSIGLALETTPDGIELSVTDDGAGLPREMLDHVFELFTQVNRTLDRAQGGLGIGLSLVRHLVELHGGTVTAHSEGLDRGSRFRVRLPPAPAPAGDTACEPAPPAPSRRKRILVVDDNVDAADALTIQLEVAGHDARTAYGGAAALQAAEAFRPEVVMCDLGMPGIDGHAVAARLRADPRHAGTVLVALTGWGSQEDRRRTRLTGFDFHLVKPVDADTIDRILAQS